MGSLLDWLRGGSAAGESDVMEAKALGATDMVGGPLCSTYLAMVYSKIMHEAADRASIPSGVDKDAYILTVHDSFSPAKRGLVSIIVKGITERSHRCYELSKIKGGEILFKEVPLNEAQDEEGNVRAGLLELDFREFVESTVLELLFALLGGVLQGMSNGVTISQAVLLRIHELSQMIDNAQNMEPIIAQLKQLNSSISQGRPGVIDAKSDLSFPSFDSKPGAEAAGFIYGMISMLTGIPCSYLFGEVVGGLGSNEEGDARRMDAAVRRYYHAIFAPALFVTFGKVFDYKKLVVDLAGLVELFTFIETTTLLTEDGKKRLLLDNTTLSEDEIDTSEKAPVLPPMAAPAPGAPAAPGQEAVPPAGGEVV